MRTSVMRTSVMRPTKKNITTAIAIAVAIAVVCFFPGILLVVGVGVVVMFGLMLAAQTYYDLKYVAKKEGVMDDVQRFFHRLKVRLVWSIRKAYIEQRETL